jgi:hypothetical protein
MRVDKSALSCGSAQSESGVLTLARFAINSWAENFSDLRKAPRQCGALKIPELFLVHGRSWKRNAKLLRFTAG